MEDVGTLVERLESRGVRFRLDPHVVGFDYDWRTLEPTDPATLGELIFERGEETRRFLERRAEGPLGFGRYAGLFRSAIQKLHNPAGMLVWLKEAAPYLYVRLDRQVDAVQGLWEGNASLEEFESAVRKLEELHRAARGFYEACHQHKEEEHEQAASRPDTDSA